VLALPAWAFDPRKDSIMGLVIGRRAGERITATIGGEKVLDVLHQGRCRFPLGISLAIWIGGKSDCWFETALPIDGQITLRIAGSDSDSFILATLTNTGRHGGPFERIRIDAPPELRIARDDGPGRVEARAPLPIPVPAAPAALDACEMEVAL
jgi:hypothetical protein